MNYQIVHGFPGPEVESSWRLFLRQADYASHYASPAFFHEPFLEKLQPFALLIQDGRRIVAAVSGVHRGKSLECGLLSRPQVAIDPSADSLEVSAAINAGLREEGRRAELIDIYSYHPLDGLKKAGFRAIEQEGVVMLDLTLGSERLWKELNSKRRNNIRKGLGYNMDVGIASTETEIAEFYPIYLQWCEGKGFPAMSLDTMQRAYALRDNRVLFTARHEGRMVAGSTLRLMRGGLVEYAANASLKDAQFFKPNDVLQWKCVEWACAEKFRHYSMGGTHLFLRQFGGRVATVHRYRLDRTILKRHDLRETLQGEARRIFQALPEPVRNRLRAAGRSGAGVE